MARRIESHYIAGPAGRLEALLEEPEEGEPRFAAVVCHPHPLHGGTMHNKVVHRIARGVRRAGGVALRFNFRGVNLSEGDHDHGAGEVDDAAAALAWLRQRYPALPAVLAGFSFGARAVLALARREAVSLVVAVGVPAWRDDAGEFRGSAIRRVFIQSTNDEYGPRDKMQAFFDSAEGPKQMIWIEARDHFFAGALEELESAVQLHAVTGD
jgi:alpha/beta superfamily hydrolase